MGETTMRIRGVDGSRINVNLNGITLNEAESQSVFWYNLPNLGGMVQSMQIQRGIGASTGGTASHSCGTGLTTDANGNFGVNPIFRDEANGDYTLKGSSPCVDAGEEKSWHFWRERPRPRR